MWLYLKAAWHTRNLLQELTNCKSIPRGKLGLSGCRAWKLYHGFKHWFVSAATNSKSADVLPLGTTHIYSAKEFNEVLESCFLSVAFIFTTIMYLGGY